MHPFTKLFFLFKVGLLCFFPEISERKTSVQVVAWRVNPKQFLVWSRFTIAHCSFKESR